MQPPHLLRFSSTTPCSVIGGGVDPGCAWLVQTLRQLQQGLYWGLPPWHMHVLVRQAGSVIEGAGVRVIGGRVSCQTSLVHACRAKHCHLYETLLLVVCRALSCRALGLVDLWQVGRCQHAGEWLTH